MHNDFTYPLHYIKYGYIIDFFRVKGRDVTTNYDIVIAFQNVNRMCNQVISYSKAYPIVREIQYS